MQMQAFRDVFLVLERTYLLRTRGTTFWQLGLASVKNQMSKSVGHRLIEGVIQLIQLDRTDEKKQNRRRKQNEEGSDEVRHGHSRFGACCGEQNHERNHEQNHEL